MNYLSVTHAAKKLALDPSRVRALCVQNRIKGCVRIGMQWAIPSPPVILPK